MPNIRPISDLRNSSNEISEFCRVAREPVFITQNGVGDMVVMSIEAYEKLVLKNKISEKLLASSIQAKSTDVRYDFDVVEKEMRAKLIENL